MAHINWSFSGEISHHQFVKKQNAGALVSVLTPTDQSNSPSVPAPQSQCTWLTHHPTWIPNEKCIALDVSNLLCIHHDPHDQQWSESTPKKEQLAKCKTTGWKERRLSLSLSLSLYFYISYIDILHICLIFSTWYCIVFRSFLQFHRYIILVPQLWAFIR